MDEFEQECKELFQGLSAREMNDFLEKVIKVCKERDIPPRSAARIIAEEMIKCKKLNALMFNNRLRIEELKSNLTSKILEAKNLADARRVFLDALEGKVTLNANKTVFMDGQPMRDIIEISSLVRENYYIYYKYVDVKVLEDEKKRAYDFYKELQRKAKENYVKFETNQSWGRFGSEKTVYSEIKEDELKDIRVIGAGDYPYEQPMTLSSEKSYPVTAFDDFYYVISNILDPKYPADTKERFEEAMSYVDAEVKSCEVSLEDYRSRRLMDLHCSSEEIDAILEHINNCLSSNKNIKQEK